MRNERSLGDWLRRTAIGLVLLGFLVPKVCLGAGPPPVITVQPLSQTVQLLGTAAFSVTASSGTTLSYQWLKEGANIAGATLSSYTIASVQATDAGTYAAKVSNAGGSVISSNAVLTVLLPPTIMTPPHSQTVTQGLSASFSVVASGTAPFGYQWNLNGTALSGATSSTLALNNVQATDAGSYTAVVTNPYGSATSGVATLTVLVPPVITTQPQSQVVMQGQSASFSVVASGTAPFTYQWYFNQKNAGGTDTLPTYTINNVNSAKIGNYTVVVANAAGSVTSGVATLSFYVPPTIQTQPLSLTVTQGQSASFSVVASGSTPLSYQWSFNGSPISRATDTSLTLTAVQAADSGSYTVAVTNPGGSITSPTATLTVNVPAGITTQPQSQAVTQGHDASFSVVASGTAPLNYQWSLNGTALPGATGPTLALTAVQTMDAGSYAVVVNNAYGSVTSAVATLTVYVPPVIRTQPINQTVTQGQNAPLSVVAIGTAPLSYQWNFNGLPVPGATNASLALTNVQPEDDGSYSAVVTNPGGSVTSAVAKLTVIIPPGITAQPQSQVVIQGNGASFSVAANGTTPFYYQWYLDGSAFSGATKDTLLLADVQATDAGSYTVVVTNPGGSVTSEVATLTVMIPPGITTQPQSLTVTQGQTALFSVEASGTAPLSYQWSLNGTAVPNATSSILTLNNVQMTNAGGYSVVVTNVAGLVTSTVATLTVTNPNITLSLSSGGGMTPSGFAFQLSVPIGSTYVILASTNNRDWTPIATNLATTASVVFTDAAASNHAMRFYRLTVQ